MFMENYKKTNIKIWKFCIIAIATLIIGILVNYLINIGVEYILIKTNTKEISQAMKNIPLLEAENLLDGIKELINEFAVTIKMNFKYNIPVKTFIVVSIIAIIVNIVIALKKDKISNIYIMLIIIFSNFILFIIQGQLLCREYMSWSVTVAFLTTFIYITLSNKEHLKLFINIVVTIFILQQTRQLNQYFYNDYVRYNQEKALSYEIANEILEKCDNAQKPLVYIMKMHEGSMKKVYANTDNGTLVYTWGYTAFGEKGTEITKFINSLGYNFTIATDEEYKDAIDEVKKEDNLSEERIIEKEKYIIVKLDYYKSEFSNIIQ